jgi:hypothetical protein
MTMFLARVMGADAVRAGAGPAGAGGDAATGAAASPGAAARPNGRWAYAGVASALAVYGLWTTIHTSSISI